MENNIILNLGRNSNYFGVAGDGLFYFFYLFGRCPGAALGLFLLVSMLDDAGLVLGY